MKSKVLLLASSLLLATSSVGAGSAKKTSKVSIARIPPFYLYEKNSLIQYSVLASITTPLRVKIYIINDLYPSGKQLSSKKHTKNETTAILYTNNYTRPSNQIKIVSSYEDGSNTENLITNVPLATGKTIVASGEQYQYVSDTCCCNYTSGIGWTYTNEKLQFNNFDEYYMPDFYHKLDLSLFYIDKLTTFPASLSCSSASLLITNRNGCFDSFPHDSTNAQIPLTLKCNDNRYYLAFQNSFYVNQLTLECSPVYKEGFVETKYFYLPRNEKRFEEEYKCQIVLNGLGIDDLKVVSKFTYKSLLNIMGDCRNSQYCIVNN